MGLSPCLQDRNCCPPLLCTPCPNPNIYTAPLDWPSLAFAGPTPPFRHSSQHFQHPLMRRLVHTSGREAAATIWNDTPWQVQGTMTRGVFLSRISLGAVPNIHPARPRPGEGKVRRPSEYRPRQSRLPPIAVCCKIPMRHIFFQPHSTVAQASQRPPSLLLLACLRPPRFPHDSLGDVVDRRVDPRCWTRAWFSKHSSRMHSVLARAVCVGLLCEVQVVGETRAVGSGTGPQLRTTMAQSPLGPSRRGFWAFSNHPGT